MSEYTVIWEINIEAESPEEAAKEALKTQRDPESTATYFMVYNEEGHPYPIDLPPTVGGLPYPIPCVSDNRIQDLLCCAFEGGSNYWYRIDQFIYPPGKTKKSLGIKFAHLELPFIEGGSLVITGYKGDESQSYILDRKAINKGLFLMAKKFPGHWGEFLAEHEDAITGDVFLQCCLFGEVIYG